jgi:hypothetical protein
MEIKVSDDKKPMTGTWYRSTSDPNVLCKVTRIHKSNAHVVMTGGVHGDYTFAEFADSWELS